MDIEKLDKVAMVARNDETRAAGTLHQHQKVLRESSARLEQVRAFKVEYAQRLDALASNGIDARRLVDYRRFLGKLNEALQLLETQINRNEQDVKTSRDAFVDRTARRGSVDELITRGRAALAEEERRAEQRQSDEISLQRHQPL